MNTLLTDKLEGQLAKTFVCDKEVTTLGEEGRSYESSTLSFKKKEKDI